LAQKSFTYPHGIPTFISYVLHKRMCFEEGTLFIHAIKVNGVQVQVRVSKSVSVHLHMCMFVAASSPNSLYVGSSADSTAKTMFTRRVNYCSLTHHIISLCLDLLPHSLEIQPALSTDTERESQSSIFSALCLLCAMFFGALPPLHMHSRKRTLLQMLPISH